MVTFSARDIVGGARLFLGGLTLGAWYFAMSGADVGAH